MLTYILFIIGFVLLIKGADYLVDGASALAKRWGLSALFIGLTVVAFGTSAPEFFVTIIASIEGSSRLAAGTIIGSNTLNILLVLGTAALIRPLAVNTVTVSREIPMSLLAAVIVGVLVNDAVFNHGATANVLSRGDGIVLVAFFIIFLYHLANVRHLEGKSVVVRSHRSATAWLMVAGGALLLLLGANWIVNGAEAFARTFGLPESFIGLTVIALGTSLPELAASAVAAYKGRTDIAVGTVVGSNIFRIFWVLGAAALIQPIYFSDNLNIDLGILVAATMLLLVGIYAGTRQTLQRWEGYIFVLLYILYIAFLVQRSFT